MVMSEQSTRVVGSISSNIATSSWLVPKAFTGGNVPGSAYATPDIPKDSTSAPARERAIMRKLIRFMGVSIPFYNSGTIIS